MKPTKPRADKRRNLEVRTEHIRQLDGDRLEQVNGGLVVRPSAGCMTTDR